MSDKKSELTKAIGTLHRKHSRKLFGHCRCGWRRDLMDFYDHSDHVSRVLMDAAWPVVTDADQRMGELVAERAAIRETLLKVDEASNTMLPLSVLREIRGWIEHLERW